MLIHHDVEDCSRGLESIAEELLGNADILQPPIDMFCVAQRLRVDVAFDECQRVRGRHKKLAGRSAILLKPDDRPERLQWAAAHELGEVFAYRAFERMGLASDDLSDGARETVANLLATRLLLPWKWFIADVRRTSTDLLMLKEIYRTASHELIGWRLLDLPEWSIVTVFDQGQLMRRRASNGVRPPLLRQLEQDCWSRVHQENRATELCSDGLTTRGWPIHEPGWKREILRTTCSEEP